MSPYGGQKGATGYLGVVLATTAFLGAAYAIWSPYRQRNRITAAKSELITPCQPKLEKHISSKRSSATTFRISEIPVSVSKTQLLDLVGSIAPESNNIVVVDTSLAPSPSDRARFQVATITFECIPPKLDPCIKNGVHVQLDITVDSVPSKITFDSHFIGLTPLNDGAGDCNVE